MNRLVRGLCPRLRDLSIHNGKYLTLSTTMITTKISQLLSKLSLFDSCYHHFSIPVTITIINIDYTLMLLHLDVEGVVDVDGANLLVRLCRF